MPTDPRSRVLQVRLTAGEVEALRTLAAAANMKPSEWTRALFAPLLIFEMSKASNAVTVPCVPLLDLHVSPTDPLPVPRGGKTGSRDPGCTAPNCRPRASGHDLFPGHAGA